MNTSLRPIVVDVETTGFGRQDRILEIAAIALDPATWEIVDEYDTLINPQRDVGPTGVHGISASMVEAAPTFPEIVADVARRLQGTVVIAHNIAFDLRMLRYEFDRCGIPFDAGEGLCTYRETRKKLILACEDRNISLSHQHRALADARATAELARKLNLKERTLAARPLHIAHIPSTPSHHTMRRGLADAGVSPMHRVVSRAHYPHCDEAIQQYLDMLDWVLDDGVIDAVEKREMDFLANDLGIAEEARMSAHKGLFGLHHQGRATRRHYYSRRTRFDTSHSQPVGYKGCRDSCRNNRPEDQRNCSRRARLFYRNHDH